MSTPHCGHCGARSTIWLPTCVFCGNPVSSTMPAVRPPPKIVRPVHEACTERKEAPRRAGFITLIREFWKRLAPIRP